MLTRGFMLDTSALNRIHDWRQCEWSLRGLLYVTEIQLQEIAQTRNRDRRASLLEAYRSLRLIVIRPMGLVMVPEFFGFANYHRRGLTQCEDYPWFLDNTMPHIASAMGSKAEKHYPDALIAETALNTNLTLVTADRRQARVGRDFGTHVEEIP
jgi:predicted nucleic acid-binding protein